MGEQDEWFTYWIQHKTPVGIQTYLAFISMAWQLIKHREILVRSVSYIE